MQRIFFASLGCCALAFGLIPGCGSDDEGRGGSGASGGSGGTGGSAGNAGSAGTGSGARGGSSGASGAAGTSGRGGGSGAGGSAGRGGAPGDAAADAPGGCLPMDFECTAGAVCCAGTECVQATPRPICLTPCQQNADCATGCCLEYGNIRGKVCAPAAECANCAPAGQACATTRCCQGTLCTTIDSVQSCAPECTAPSDCATGCCVPLGNLSRSVCLDARYCPPPP